MAKRYSDRAMKNDTPDREYVFTKAAKVIRAKSREEAEKKLKAKNK